MFLVFIAFNIDRIPGLTDKFMLPMKVAIGKSYKGCISSLDIITKNAQGETVVCLWVYFFVYLCNKLS